MKDITTEEATKIIKNFIDYFNKNKDDGNKANLCVLGEEIKAIEKVLNELERYKELYVSTLGHTLNNSIAQSIKANEDLEALNEGWKIELKKKDTQINLYKKLYENLQQDFEAYKNDKDINYLDRNHHKQLVDKSIGQTIDKPEECWFDIFEVKVIKNNKLYGVAINDDFVNLKRISDEDPDNCITVIAESPLSGAIYRYNNYGKKEWQLIGTMLGYA